MRLRSILAILILVACQKTEQPAPPPTETAPPATTTQAAAPPPPPAPLEGFQTPESVLYDSEQDVYFISNINGQPTDNDDNGFISRVNAATLQVEMKWIDGARPDVTLNAPKGMALVGDELWVTDITWIRKFDRRTGAPKGMSTSSGRTFLNDLVSDGVSAWASDSGLTASAGSFQPNGTDAVVRAAGTGPEIVASGSALNRPNGLALVGGKIWVVSFGSNELYSVENGQKGTVTTLPKGSLDGIVAMGDGSFLISSWDGKAVYRGIPGEAFTPIVENVDAPADIGYDGKRGLLMIPHFMENRVTFHSVR